MLTGSLVRVRFARNRIIPAYIDPAEARWQLAAQQLLDLFRGQEGRTRGELEADVEEAFGGDAGQLVHRGLAKLLEDRCEFETVSGQPPEKIRDVVFRLAARERVAASKQSVGWAESSGPTGLTSPQRQQGDDSVGLENSTHLTASVLSTRSTGLDTASQREATLRLAAIELEISPEAVEQGLFADLKSEQRLTRFRDITPERLIDRYNVALVQGILLRSTQVRVTIRAEKPARYRQLFRSIKFHRLICDVARAGTDSCRLNIDGPLSLFSATQKYGVQLGLFLPAILRCRDFELEADLRWGTQRKPKTLSLSSGDGLVSHAADAGVYVPPELAMFVELFRKRVADWDIAEEAEVFPLGDAFWVPDFRLTHRPTGKSVLVEVLGFWRRASAEKHLERLRRHAPLPFLLAVSDQLHVDDAALEGLPAGVHRFRQLPLPDEVARLAQELVSERERVGEVNE
jgi:predicted nuclease of restriction endonuclease-like RecB superfamily